MIREVASNVAIGKLIVIIVMLSRLSPDLPHLKHPLLQ